MEGPHKKKVYLNTSTYLIKRRENKHFLLEKSYSGQKAIKQ